MAGLKISELTKLSEATGSEMIPVAKDGENYSLTTEDLLKDVKSESDGTVTRINEYMYDISVLMGNMAVKGTGTTPSTITRGDGRYLMNGELVSNTGGVLYWQERITNELGWVWFINNPKYVNAEDTAALILFDGDGNVLKAFSLVEGIDNKYFVFTSDVKSIAVTALASVSFMQFDCSSYEIQNINTVIGSFSVSIDAQKDSLTLKYKNMLEGKDVQVEIPAATETTSGALSSSQKKILNNFAISFDPSDTSAHTLKLVYRSLNTGEGIKINVPIATSDVNGLLSAIQKGLLDKFSIYVDYNETTGALLLKYQMLDRDAVQTITIPVASQTINGLLSATQKKALDTFSISIQNILNVPLLKYTDLINGSIKTVVIPAASTTSNGLMSSVDKQKLDSLSPKEELFIDMWNSACGTAGQYNRETGYYELNGLTDITYEQALKIYQNTAQTYLSQYSTELFSGSPIIRTNICPNVNSSRGNWVRIDSTSMFSGNNAIEVIAVSQLLNTNTQKWSFNNVNYMFNGCTKFRKVIGGIFNFGITSENRQRSVFVRCSLLNRVLIEGIIVSLSFSDSPLISYESLKYLVDNAANTTAITITVHATTYSYLTGELEPTDVVGGTTEEWQQLMTDATAKQISFAKLS